jgi:hypothetical protein
MKLSTARLTDIAAINKFLFAGNATFTLVSAVTGTRFTFKSRHCGDDGKDLFFVSVLTGADNEASYTYLGQFVGMRGFQHGRKSVISPDAPSAKALAWFSKFLNTPALPDVVEFWHEGRCCRCGRKLTVPASIASGIGPECATKI